MLDTSHTEHTLPPTNRELAIDLLKTMGSLSLSRLIAGAGELGFARIVATMGTPVQAASALFFVIQAVSTSTTMVFMYNAGYRFSSLVTENNFLALGKEYRAGLLLAVFTGIIAAGVALGVSYLLPFFGQTENTAAFCQAYFWGAAPAMLLINLSVLYQQLMVTQNKHWQVPVYSLLCALAINAIAYGFSFFSLALEGFSRTLGLLLALLGSSIYLARAFGKTLFCGAVEGNIIRAQTKLGLPMGLQILGEMIGLEVAAIMSGWLGESALLAQQASTQFWLLLATGLHSLAQASGMSIKRRLTDNNIGTAKRITKISLGLAMTIALIPAALFCAIPEQLLLFFLNPAMPDFIGMMAQARTLMYVHAASLIADTVRNVASGGLRANNEPWAPFWISGVFSSLVVALPLGYALGFYTSLGLTGIYLGRLIAKTLAAVITVLKLAHSFKASSRPLLPTQIGAPEERSQLLANDAAIGNTSNYSATAERAISPAAGDAPTTPLFIPRANQQMQSPPGTEAVVFSLHSQHAGTVATSAGTSSDDKSVHSSNTGENDSFVTLSSRSSSPGPG